MKENSFALFALLCLMMPGVNYLFNRQH